MKNSLQRNILKDFKPLLIAYAVVKKGKPRLSVYDIYDKQQAKSVKIEDDEEIIKVAIRRHYL